MPVHGAELVIGNSQEPIKFTQLFSVTKLPCSSCCLSQSTIYDIILNLNANATGSTRAGTSWMPGIEVYLYSSSLLTSATPNHHRLLESYRGKGFDSWMLIWWLDGPLRLSFNLSTTLYSWAKTLPWCHNQPVCQVCSGAKVWRQSCRIN